METERWQQVDSLLQSALERPPEEREAFLRNACGDDLALEEEIRSLLSAYENAGSFLESPAIKAAAQTIAQDEDGEETQDSNRSLVGQAISHYRILRKLGAGGMGEVYRAHDSVLKRDVAIKILPTYVAQDADRLRRFEQEAQAAAALNHPNILAVHEFGTFEGVTYLVSELLEGQTLRQLLRRGPMAVRKAIDYSVQIARGLAAAHEKGIVHRDLKPENLFVSKGGHVKILDFGLAKLTYREPEAHGFARHLSHDTDPGVVVGTPGYMAPEQVRRRPADHRTDVFAFGATLYEMLSGKRAFQRETSAETITAILKDDPPSISEVLQSLPPGLQRVVHRCLEKNPEQRFQSASDLAFALEALSNPSSPVQPARTEPKPRPHSSRVLTTIAGCCACVLLLAVAWLAYKKWHASPTPPVQRALTRVTFDEGLQTGTTWSPDGRFIAYSSDRGGKFDIWVQQISGGDPIQVTKGPGQNWQPDWSPDGKYIAYRSEEGTGGIYITPALGGEGQQRKIAPFGYFPRWSPDSSRILFHSAMGRERKRVYVVGMDGSSPREVLTDLGHDIGVVFATWHPDGKRITAWTSEAGEPFPISTSATPNFLTESVDGGSAIRSTFPSEVQKEIDPAGPGPILDELRMDFRFAWAPSGKAVLFERAFHGVRNIWRMTVDPATLQPTKVERMTTSPGIDAELSISHDGSRLAFTSEHHQLRVWAYPFDANHGRLMGAGEPVTTPEIEAWAVNLSRDGKKLAVKGNRDGRVKIWGVSLSNGREEPFLPDDSYFRDTPIWSPDGRRSAYLRTSTSNRCQFVVWSSENRTEYPITAEGPDGGWVYDWSPDGKSLLFTGGEDLQIWQLPVDPSPLGKSVARKIIANPNYELYQPHFSPSGRWIVFDVLKHLSPRGDSILYAMPSAGGPWTQITDGKQWDDKPRWSPDGKTIYFLSERRGFFNLWGAHFDPVKGRPQGERFQVTSFETPALMIPKDIPPVDISLTDRRLALPLAQTSGNIWILDNVDQ